jgi:hypothetical protein
MTVLSGQAAAVAVAAWFLAVAWGGGDWILERIEPRPAGATLSRLVISTALGLTALSFLALLLALAHVLTLAASLEALGTLTVFLGWERLRRRGSGNRAPEGNAADRGREPCRSGHRSHPAGVRGARQLRLGPAGVQYDAMNHQLSVPQAYATPARGPAGLLAPTSRTSST